MKKFPFILLSYLIACSAYSTAFGANENKEIQTEAQENGFYSEFAHEGFYVKDYFVYRNPENEVYHLYYNTGEAGPRQHWRDPFNEEQFGHATSKDLKTWVIHDTILPVVPGTWESDVVSAPFVVRHDGQFYMAYTAFGGGNANQRMGIATSDDLFNWERIPENPVAVGPEWTNWKETGWANFRDPGLLKWQDQWLAFNTVTSAKGKDAVAISISKDLVNWEHLPEEKAIFADWGNPESALAFKRGEKVYLIASQPWQGAQMWMTDDPLSGDWKTIPFEFPEGDWSGWEYIASPEGKDLLSAFLWKKNGNFIRFWEIEWDGDLPRLISKSTTANGGFEGDVKFMSQHTPIILLQDGDAAVAIAPDYQGRVMTSTYDRESGPSFGWINRPVIEKGVLSEEEAEGQLQQHIHVFGGEERFWLGPEGGQYALFFKPGDRFEFADWKTPAAIDTEPFELTKKTPTSAHFKHQAKLMNFSGTLFEMAIERSVNLLNHHAIEEQLGMKLPDGLRTVAYETDNRITNIGEKAWVPESGLPSIWTLGMYNPSPKTNVIIPFQAGSEAKLGPRVNDRYFGKVPPDYLKVEDDRLFFRGDGTLRSKIGITPQRSLGIAGSYDAEGQVLTLVTYNVQDAPHGFVNSMWEHQEAPYAGDVINAYNDGPPEPGADPLGPFYELETSSPAAALQPGETMRHIQRTFHIQGPEALLDPLAKQILGTELMEIKAAFGEN